MAKPLHDCEKPGGKTLRKNRTRLVLPRTAFSPSCDVRQIQNEKLTDLELLCDRYHAIADRNRERDAQEAFEEPGEEARDAAGMNTYFTHKYGEDWRLQFRGDPREAYSVWEEWKERKAEEDFHGYC